MDKFLEIFSEFVNNINRENSRLYKEEVLKKYKNNLTVKYLLNFIYNTFIVTGISDKKLNKKVNALPSVVVNDIFGLCDYLKEHNSGRDKDIAVVQYFMSIKKGYEELIKSIVTKNLVLGIQVKTINKIFGDNFIPTFSVQLAEKYFDNINHLKGKYISITLKCDGSRIVAIKHNGKVEFYNRSGKPEEGLVEIEKELLDFPLDNFVLDGELMIENEKGLPSKERYQRTMKIARSKGEKKGLKILVFDLLPYMEFANNKCTKEYAFRRKKLDSLFANKMKCIKVLPVLYSGNDYSKIIKLTDELTNKGEEGVMVNVNSALYQFKRTKDLLKVKKMQDIDAKVIRLEEGSNKYSGTLGSLVIEYKGNEVKVGSGLSDELRDEVWNNKSKYLGKTVEVQYFEETKNQNGGISLRFPVFKDFRFDK